MKVTKYSPSLTVKLLEKCPTAVGPQSKLFGEALINNTTVFVCMV